MDLVVFQCRIKRDTFYYDIVISWTKGLRYRPNRIQCCENRGIVGYINVSSILSTEQFRRKGLRDPGHERFRDTCAIGREKTKETLKTMLVKTQARTNAKGVQYELRSESVRAEKPKTRVVEL